MLLRKGKKGKFIPVQAVEALRDVRGWASHIYRHSAHRWRQGCQPYALATFYPHLVLIFVRGWVTPRAIVRLEGLGKLKNSTSSGTQTGNLPACSIVPQPTTLPCAPKCYLVQKQSKVLQFICYISCTFLYLDINDMPLSTCITDIEFKHPAALIYLLCIHVFPSQTWLIILSYFSITTCFSHIWPS
jgi:hypothetical protein